MDRTLYKGTLVQVRKSALARGAEHYTYNTTQVADNGYLWIVDGLADEGGDQAEDIYSIYSCRSIATGRFARWKETELKIHRRQGSSEDGQDAV
jgi:hypothetical protein